MVVELFASLLEELSKVIHYKLHVDSNNSCLIRMPNGLNVQMEIHRKGTHFIIGSDIGNVPVGRYRENFFKEALRSNGLPPPNPGIFAYSKTKDQLILFLMLPLHDLTGQKIADKLKPFVEKAFIWHTALSKGDTPVVETGNVTSVQRNPFGM